MKKFLAASLLLLVFLGLEAQVDFRKITSSEEMENVWADAKSQNKPVFVDIYATWCGPCKWMDANVFATEEAGEFMNKEFINVKMDGESSFGRVFAAEQGLTSYPSFFVFQSDKALMNLIIGAKDWGEFEPTLSMTITYYPMMEELQAKLDKQTLEQEEYADLLKALQAFEKEREIADVVRRYRQEFLGEDEWSETDIRVLAFNVELLSKDWDILTSDLSKLRSALEEELEGFIDHIVEQSIALAIEEDDLKYINYVQDILPKLVEMGSVDLDNYEMLSYISYYFYSDKIEALINYVNDEYNTRTEDHRWLYNAANYVFNANPEDEEIIASVKKWMNTCLALEKNQEYYYLLALSEYMQDELEEAVRLLKEAKSYAEDPDQVKNLEEIIRQVEEQMEQ